MTQAIPRDKYLAGGLAFMVHLLFFAVLVLGVSWKRLPDVPVYADIWRDLPSPMSAPRPEVKLPKLPEAPKPPPKAMTELESRPGKADIALKSKEAARKHDAELRLEELKKRQADEKRRQLADEVKRKEQAELAQEAKQLQLKQERLADEQKKQAQDKAKKNLDALLNQQMSQELNQESQAIRQQAASAERSRQIADYVGRIQQKIRGELRLPVNLQGNPEVVYRVDLLPNGDLIRLTLVQSSRQPAYDLEVERAIRKASPLPLPPDRDLASSFRSGLELHFRPHDR